MNIRNIELLEIVANVIGDELNRRAVYVGGSTTALLVAPDHRSQVRHSKDVDIIVDIVTKPDYHTFCEKLKARGFTEDIEDSLICRYRLRDYPDIKLDVMPIDKRILGFSNRWYPDAIANTFTVELGHTAIRLTKPPWFLATKFEAWLGRGNGDIFAHDMEDILFVLEHRPEIVDEIAQSPGQLRDYLVRQINALQASSLGYYLEGFADTPQSAVEIQNRLFRISKL